MPVISYEGDRLPQEVGWTESSSIPYPDRFNAEATNGVLMLDSDADSSVTARWEQTFQAEEPQTKIEWCTRTSNNDGAGTLYIGIFGPTSTGLISVGHYADYVLLEYSPDSSAINAKSKIIPIDAAECHAYEIVSTDSRFELLIDGMSQADMDLQTLESVSTMIRFGLSKISYNLPTTSEWDYVRVSTIPEPTTAIFLITCAVPLLRRRFGNPPAFHRPSDQ
jgi:hypothetical protein